MDNAPQIIAGTYQVIGQIGSGGGGVVYLAEHLRLHKKVVLKADKRTLTAKPEVLRREVDALKDLSHTYIPQVYDFIVEDGVVYTVMDFIDGDSFDKPLKRGERFDQASVVEWACQLLEALDYLHSRPPHGILHADIKPANIMLTPQGDVRLIDFNIALALGEEGAIAVGRSFGYASPEHYGTDYAPGNATRGVATDVLTDLTPPGLTSVETVLETGSGRSASGSTSGRKVVMLDVRSDIYSLGATLYHIMTGRRPAQKATEVEPIQPGAFSPAVIAIITKAMNPDSTRRYQSAREMLHAFEHLREGDPRSRRHKRRVAVTVALLATLFLAGGLTAFVGLKQQEQLQNAYVLAEYSGSALRAGDVELAIDYALQALPRTRNLFTPPDTAEAQKALTDALGVYDLADGFKDHKAVTLPSAPLALALSPEGGRGAAVYAYAVAVFDIESGRITATLPTEPSALSEVRFVSESCILYAGEAGLTAYDLTADAPQWVGEVATAIALSADGRRVAAVYKDSARATVYDTASGQLLHTVDFEGKRQRVTVNDSFANPNDNLLALNADGTLLAVSFEDGALWVYDLTDSEGDLELFDDTSGFYHFEGGFSGQYLAFSASNAGESVFAVIDTEALEQTGGFDAATPFGVQADESGIYVQTGHILVKIHPETGEQTPLVTTLEPIIRFARSAGHTLIATAGEYMIYNARAGLVARGQLSHSGPFLQIAGGTALLGSLDTPAIRALKLVSHAEAEVFAYDPTYAHDEARLNEQDRTVMLFSYNQFLIYNLDGQIVNEVLIPDAEQLYDQQFRRDADGARLEVIYNDGTVRAYSAADGGLMWERPGEAPDLSLYEEFFTDTLRIESPLHGTPAAYDRESGKLVRQLEQDAYLTYVTQVGAYVITEYVSAQGERYGLLLNSRCETLAYLPYLCDIVGENLIFDYPTGNLRQSRIYSIDELIAQAK